MPEPVSASRVPSNFVTRLSMSRTCRSQRGLGYRGRLAAHHCWNNHIRSWYHGWLVYHNQVERCFQSWSVRLPFDAARQLCVPGSNETTERRDRPQKPSSKWPVDQSLLVSAPWPISRCELVLALEGKVGQRACRCLQSKFQKGANQPNQITL
jgi:hypothetical protein